MSHYILFLNKEILVKNSYSYRFGRTEVKLTVGNQSARIEYNMTTKHKTEDLLNYDRYIVSDAIKKACLVHVILYSKMLNIKCVKANVDNITYQFDADSLICSLIPNGMLVSVSDQLKTKDVVEKIVQLPKTKQGSEYATLFAYLLAKTKVFDNETERLVYLWMSFNGFYNYLYKLYNDSKGKVVEKKKLSYFISSFNLGKCSLKEEKRNYIIPKVVNEIINNNIEFVCKDSFIENCSDFMKTISEFPVDESGNLAEMSPYAILLVELPYYLRCKIFHASEPIKIFSYEEEPDIKVLRFASNILEDFLDNNIHLLFDTEKLDLMVNK